MLLPNIKALLANVSGAGRLYTYIASHEFLSDIPSAAYIAGSTNLSGESIGADGGFVEAIVLPIDTGTAGSSRLIMFQARRQRREINVDTAGWFVLQHRRSIVPNRSRPWAAFSFQEVTNGSFDLRRGAAASARA